MDVRGGPCLGASPRARAVTGATLDSGALIALEAGTARMRALVREALATGTPIAIPAGVLAQIWRGTARQARIARLIRAKITEVVPLDQRAALAIGKLCRRTGADDVVDVSVALCARERSQRVVTSDPETLTIRSGVHRD